MKIFTMMKTNPFKFGTVVKEPFFTNRKEEIKKVKTVISGENHLIIIGPRRFGKTSLIYRVVEKMNRPVIFIDMQLVNSIQGLAALILKKLYKEYTFERIKQSIKNFRIIPSASLNPVTGEIDVKFMAGQDIRAVELEDVLNLCNELASPKKKPVFIFDEFQEVFRIEKTLVNKMRSMMQNHAKINYVFLGSQESMIREIFEKKKSPFYNFGYVMNLSGIPETEFSAFIAERFSQFKIDTASLASDILEITRSHPYFTQQLAYFTWDLISTDNHIDDPVNKAVDELVKNQDNNFERLWSTLITTDRKVLISLARSNARPLSNEFSEITDNLPVATISSSLKRLVKENFLLKYGSEYIFDDPFFKIWLSKRLEA
jgi:AAA+ ATPase superfamily predicted ATPase